MNPGFAFRSCAPAALAVAVAVAGCGGAGDDAHLQRGRALLVQGEPDAAVRELRLALKARPGDRTTQAMLLVALERDAGELASWYESQILFDRLRYLRGQHLEGLDGYQELEARLTTVRRRLYDKGLDTKDAEALWDVSRVAARYSLTVARGATDDERDHAAFALALDGDQAAIAHLVERLKSEQADHVPALIARTGSDVEDALLAEVARRESLARPRALDTLARMRERQVAEALFRDAPTVRGVRDDDVAIGLRGPGTDGNGRGFTRDQTLYGMNLHADDEARLRTWWLATSADRATRLLLVQAFDTASHRIVTRFYRFADGRIAPLGFAPDAAIADALATEGLVRSFTLDGDKVSLTQRGRGEVAVEVERAQSSYATGDRVRLRGLGKDGVVAGRDEFGLLTVRLDTPHRGLATMAVAPAALRGLATELQPRVGLRTYDVSLADGRITLTTRATALAPLEDTDD